MDYGNRAPHVSSPNDLCILKCPKCEWVSDELTREERAKLGIPWYCAQCDATNLRWVVFQPSERSEAYRALALQVA